MEQLYYKHKFFFYKQIGKNSVTSDLFSYLNKYYKNNNISNKNTFFKQLFEANDFVGVDLLAISRSEAIKAIDAKFVCSNVGLVDSLRFIMLNLKVTRDYVEMIFLLNKFLDYNNYKDVMIKIYQIYFWIVV